MNFWASQPIFEVKNILVISKLKLAVNETTHAIYSQNFELLFIKLYISIFQYSIKYADLAHIILGVMKVL